MGSKGVLGIINIRRDTSYVKFLKAFENRVRWFKNDLEFRVKVLDFLVTVKSVGIDHCRHSHDGQANFFGSKASLVPLRRSGFPLFSTRNRFILEN